jgi:hypothetical protein
MYAIEQTLYKDTFSFNNAVTATACVKRTPRSAAIPRAVQWISKFTSLQRTLSTRMRD